MSTAVIITGQVRTFATCLPTLQWHVFRQLEDPHFFCSVADDDTAADIHLLEGYYSADRIHIEKVKQPDITEPHASKTRHAPYKISSSVQAILRQLWALNRGWEFFSQQNPAQFEQNKVFRITGGFQAVVRCRPDLWFRRFDKPHSVPPERTAAGTQPTAFVPHWSCCGGINDRFAYLTPAAAAQYFTAFTKLQSMLDDGCPLHPESITLEALKRGGVRVSRTLEAVFSSLRPNGQFDGPITYPGEEQAFQLDLARL